MQTMVYDSFTAWINKFLVCMGGCFGTCAKPTFTTVVNNLSRGNYNEGRTVEKSSISEDFWTTSTYDIDNSAAQSLRSVSSMSTSNQSLLCDPGTGSKTNEFVNHGLLLWNQARNEWTSGMRHVQSRCRQGVISSSATYDSLLANRERFRHPIPLSEMVDFLVDVWEQEGLYD